jgi:transcriptional regulator with XRE-family HTH domain
MLKKAGRVRRNVANTNQEEDHGKNHLKVQPDSLANIGDRLRLLRLSQRRTIQEVADTSNLSKSMISKIENGKTVPSIASLIRIGNALGTPISNLLEENDHGNTTIVANIAQALSNVVATEKGYSVFPYAAEFQEKKMQPFLFFAQKGKVVPHSLSHEGEEFIYIIEGMMKMKIGEVEYLLKEGDSLYFNSLQKHGIIPVSDQVIYLDVFV